MISNELAHGIGRSVTMARSSTNNYGIIPVSFFGINANTLFNPHVDVMAKKTTQGGH